MPIAFAGQGGRLVWRYNGIETEHHPSQHRAAEAVSRTGGDFKVLEINSGIMMESFARMNAQNYTHAKSIYQQALEFLIP